MLGVDTGVKVKCCEGDHMLIGELADRTGASARSLRYYEQQGLLEPDRTSTGYRVYAEADVVRVRRIRALLGAGFASHVVGPMLPCVYGDDDAAIDLCPEVAAQMRRTLADIEDELATLGGQRDAVRDLLARAR